jgi:hypothetical protein
MENRLLKMYDNGNIVDATLHFEESEHPFVQLFSATFNSDKIEGEKLYYCMQDLHQVLDSHNIKLLCNAFRYDVHPTPMALSMGHGINAVKLIKGKKASELVNIFDPTDDIDAVVSVEDQKNYYLEWRKSLGH